MVSFDVVSLFTNVPMELAIQVTEHYLRNDPELEIHTPLTVEEIISLLKLCLNATYLRFRGSYYQQIHGTAIGSPVSVVVANLVIEEVEQRAINSFSDTKRLFWKQYVDDPFTAIHKFHQRLNSVVDSLKFTFEVEVDRHLPFLDVMVHRNGDGLVSISVYTHLDQYLQFTSHHPTTHKSSVVCTFFH